MIKEGDFMWKNIEFIQNGLYEHMKNEGFVESYLLDSNIVMSLRDLFYNPSKMKDDEINGLLNLVDFLKNRGIISSVAIRELSWNIQDVRVDDIKYNRYNEALRGLFFDPLVKDRIVNKKDYISEYKPKKGTTRQLDSIYENIEQNISIITTMSVLIKIYELFLIYDIEKDCESIYNDICIFMSDEIGVFGAYELLLIQHLLFSNDQQKKNEIRRLLKLNNKKDIKKNLWNSSWDILFMRIITAVSVNSVRGDSINDIHNPILVTCDKDLYKLTSYFLSTIKFEKINDRLYPVLSYVADNDKHFDLITSMDMTIRITQENRLKKHNSIFLEKRAEKFIHIIKITEESINNLLGYS
ncbi:MAG: hypothetical protein JJT76_10530 [Clostridiaceae bacterium]|nr:hypothetical protein [Clostridiaceae bacterium]